MSPLQSPEPATVPSIDVIIVNWNAGAHLRRTLTSIEEADRSGISLHRVVVVDNASTDDSLAGLTDLGRRLPLSIVRNATNRGFAAACNQGAAGTAADYLLFLNPDTTLTRDALRAPLVYLAASAQADVGICGVRIVDDDGEPGTACARFPTLAVWCGQITGLSRVWPGVFKPHLMASHECLQTRTVDQVIGAFFLVRRTLYDRLAGFDERFFVYFEEVDFSLRARQHGFRSVYLADTTIHHRGGLSSEQVRAARLFYSVRSRLQYARKHYSALHLVLLNALTWGVEPWVRLAHAGLRRSPRQAVETVQAYLMLGRWLLSGSASAGGRTRDGVSIRHDSTGRA